MFHFLRKRKAKLTVVSVHTGEYSIANNSIPPSSMRRRVVTTGSPWQGPAVDNRGRTTPNAGDSGPTLFPRGNLSIQCYTTEAAALIAWLNAHPIAEYSLSDDWYSVPFVGKLMGVTVSRRLHMPDGGWYSNYIEFV